MKLVYEVNGSDVRAVDISASQITTAEAIQRVATRLAFERGAPLSDVSMRFVEE